MRIINSNTFIINFKPNDKLFRLYPVINKENNNHIDYSYMNLEKQCCPIQIISINKKELKVKFSFYINGAKIKAAVFDENELIIGKWLDGWKLYKENEDN